MIIAANLKTNLTREKTLHYLKEVEHFLEQNSISQEVLVFPAISNLNAHQGRLIVGTQNAYPAINGAFTGEIGYEQLEEFGIKTILIGHSERRHILGETQESLVAKFDFYKNLGFKIVYCVGEPLSVRESGHEKMMACIAAQYDGIDTSYENLIIAYEPVWAIGTGLTATPEQAQEVHAATRSLLAPGVAAGVRILYGGSVKPQNAVDLFAQPDIDGGLIGGASLQAEDFLGICRAAV